jgi:hypothetical protein
MKISKSNFRHVGSLPMLDRRFSLMSYKLAVSNLVQQPILPIQFSLNFVIITIYLLYLLESSFILQFQIHRFLAALHNLLFHVAQLDLKLLGKSFQYFG